MEFPALRLMAFLLLAGIDTGIAVYYRYIEVDTKVGYAAHAAGAAVGATAGAAAAAVQGAAAVARGAV